jgi:hypothetical protein
MVGFARPSTASNLPVTVSVFRANPAESLALHGRYHGLCGLPFQ